MVHFRHYLHLLGTWYLLTYHTAIWLLKIFKESEGQLDRWFETLESLE